MYLLVREERRRTLELINAEIIRAGQMYSGEVLREVVAVLKLIRKRIWMRELPYHSRRKGDRGKIG